jgi:hypothetical protein
LGKGPYSIYEEPFPFYFLFLWGRLDDGKSKTVGNPGNMYPYLGKDAEERQKNLKIFKEWVGSWNLKRRNELTEEEIQKIIAPQ